VSGHRNPAGVDLWERAQKREPGQGIVQLIGLEQLQLQLVARFLSIGGQFPVQEVSR
jgi:hypothetical protein